MWGQFLSLKTRMSLSLPFLLTVYYDGGCPVCTREIGFYQRQRGADRVRWINLAQCDDTQLGMDLSLEAAYARLHARLPGGGLVAGARAFAALWQALPAFRVFGQIAALPGVIHLLEGSYRGFLMVRRLWRRPSSACPLPGRPPKT